MNLSHHINLHEHMLRLLHQADELQAGIEYRQGNLTGYVYPPIRVLLQSRIDKMQPNHDAIIAEYNECLLSLTTAVQIYEMKEVRV